DTRSIGASIVGNTMPAVGRSTSCEMSGTTTNTSPTTNMLAGVTTETLGTDMDITKTTTTARGIVTTDRSELLCWKHSARNLEGFDGEGRLANLREKLL